MLELPVLAEPSSWVSPALSPLAMAAGLMFTIMALPAVADPFRNNIPPVAPVAPASLVTWAEDKVEVPVRVVMPPDEPLTLPPWLSMVELAAVAVLENVVVPPAALLSVPPMFLIDALAA